MNSIKPSMAYPFVTRRQVLERLDHDPVFVRECIAVLHRRHIERETLEPPAGWMSSHRKIGEEMFVRLSCADFTGTDVKAAAALAKRYSKQLARVARDAQLAADSRLGLAAAVYGIRRADPEVENGDDSYARDEDASDDAAEAAHSAPETPSVSAVAGEPNARAATPRRRPGRPKGSKNRVKTETRSEKPAKRRRR